MTGSSRNSEDILRLRDEIEDISHMMTQQQEDCKDSQIHYGPSCTFGCGTSESKLSGSGKCDNRDLNAYVDTLVKRKLGHLMDDVYNLKKTVMNSDCAAKAGTGGAFGDSVPEGKVRINYASEELGARVLSVVAVPIGGTNLIKKLLGLEFNANPPINILRPSLAPGACFGFKGSRATLTLQLAKSIRVEAIAMSHVAKEMTPRLCSNSAPKDFDVYGLREDCQKRELLGHWKYDNDAKKRTQSYNVKPKFSFRKLVFVFNSNHGANATCVYR
ncbi:hypothetical protein KR074_001528 [Drosophila pseudoananassae]|nr:hypothetical protein KR074_001528 [Drosophila pseudoananassae]